VTPLRYPETAEDIEHQQLIMELWCARYGLLEPLTLIAGHKPFDFRGHSELLECKWHPNRSSKEFMRRKGVVHYMNFSKKMRGM